MKPKFKIVKVDTGFCQITYTCRNSENQRIFYCLQDNGPNHGGIRFLRCTQDHEPNYEVTLKNPASFEIPTGDSELEKLCRDWIAKHGAP